MTEQTKYMMDKLGDNYFPLTIYHLNQEDKIHLGDDLNRVCRFCKKDNTETTFDSVAHAIPEFIGNKKLISNYECDECNQKFSRLLESHMGNYMNLWHTLTQVRGKKKVPSFKTINDKSRIDIGSEKVNIEDHEGDNIAEIDEKNKTITITANKRSYVPIAIYKTLTKMALTIMPEDELEYFKTTIAWINEENHNESPHNLNTLFVLMSYAGGIKPIPFVSCMLFKRKTDHKDTVPNMLFLVAYSNFVFQIYVPLCSEDRKLIGGKMDLTFIPIFLDLEGVKLTRKKLNMNSKEKVTEDKETIVMQFEKIVDMPIE